MNRLSLLLIAAGLLAPSLGSADVFGPTKPGARLSYQAPKSEAVVSMPRPAAPSQESVASSSACSCKRG